MISTDSLSFITSEVESWRDRDDVAAVEAAAEANSIAAAAALGSMVFCNGG